ncbi:c1e9adc6-5ed4-49c4-bd1f-30767350b634-CDS [Sclerotinia trifoliorum]|uniref:C1e9adc6-5ed4-49c4-bd1f-30767350b634-CDS n=1 Tax=Sclerotinia trifoliorum TaxID=28548 RepID=A0A8H2W0F6_9HELO|nr:c1e9adc6-5ed4-49c4-bd1f-30767350b634-CDS [Sclerotinia trifoliorum]
MTSTSSKRDPTTHMTEVNFGTRPEAKILDVSKLILSDTYPEAGSTGKSPRLTFGVELEMVICTLGDTCLNPIPGDRRKVYGVASALNSPLLEYDPVSAQFGEGTPTKMPREEISCRDKGRLCVYEDIVHRLSCAGFPAAHMEAPECRERGYTPWMADKWIVGTDSSINCPDETIYDYHKIELKSPVYYFSKGALEAVETVWEIIESTYKVVINDSMGLHVHVGNGVDAFDVPTLRNLWAILWSTEKWIETIHPPHRIDNAACLSFHYCSKLWFEIGSLSSDPEDEVLDWILKRAPPMVEAFLDTMKNADCAYNFTKLQKKYYEGSIMRTIEFRQHEATTDKERVTQWIRTCVGLVQASAATDPAKLDPYLRRLIQRKREEVHVGDILENLGLESAAYYRAQIPREKVPDESAFKKLLKKTKSFPRG